MKMIIAVLFSMMLIAENGLAQGQVTNVPPATPKSGSVNLAWDHSQSTNVTAYIVRRGPSSFFYTEMMRLGRVSTATWTNLLEGVTNYFVVSAVNSNGIESDPSNEVMAVLGQVRPVAPFLRSAVPVTVYIRSKRGDADWVIRATNPPVYIEVSEENEIFGTLLAVGRPVQMLEKQALKVSEQPPPIPKRRQNLSR